MSFYNGILNHEDIYGSSQTGVQGPPGLKGDGYKLTSDGNYDIKNKKLTNVKNGDADNDVMVKSQIEGYVSNKTQYLEGVNPGQVINNKAVIYSNSGSIHSNALYLKDQYGQEVNFHTEDQDDNQIRLYIPNLKNNDSYGGRLKSSLVITSIDQTIPGKKIFHDIEVPTPSIMGHACNKSYVDNEISKISDASDNSNYVKKSGDTMSGSLIVPKDNFPVQGDLNKVISYETTREIFLSRKETRPINTELDMGGFSIDNVKDAVNSDQAVNKRTLDSALNTKANTNDLNDYIKKDGSIPMTGNLQMNNNRIYKLPDPQLADEPATLGYVSKLNNNLFNSYLDLAGIRKMTGNLQMNNNQIIGLTNPPSADDFASNKKYVDDTISKANIKPSSIPKNAFKYLMDDINEWSSEYNIKVEKFIDLSESPHSWDKRVLSITPIKDGANYRFRLGLQMFPVKTNETYSLVVELYNRDFKTWGRQQTYIEGAWIWLKSHHTTKFQHQYGSSGDLYYTKTLIKFKKTSDSAPIFVYYTIHFDDNMGDMNTYPKEFKNQVYILAYGIIRETDHVDSGVYDKHDAFEIDKTKMKMLVPLDMNGKQLMNINLDLKFSNIFKIIKCDTRHSNDRKYFIIVRKDNNQIFSFNVGVFIASITFHNKQTFDKNASMKFITSGLGNDYEFKLSPLVIDFGSVRKLNIWLELNTGFRTVRLMNLTNNLRFPFDVDFILSYM